MLCPLLGCFLSFSLSALPTLAGEKVLDVGPKGVEIASEIAADDAKVKFDFMDKTFAMPAKTYTLKLVDSHRYRITMDTDNPKFDPFLILKNKKGEVVAFDDDGGGKLNAMINFSFAADGAPYQLFAASLHGKPGPYQLQITQQATVFWDPAVHELKKGGLKLSGALTDERQEIVYKVKLDGGRKVRIDMTSAKVDSYLELRDASGKLLAENDDVGGKLNARIVRNIGAAGTYRIVASSPNHKQVGPFTLEVKEE